MAEDNTKFPSNRFDNSQAEGFLPSQIYSSLNESLMSNEGDNEKKTLHKVLELILLHVLPAVQSINNGGGGGITPTPHTTSSGNHTSPPAAGFSHLVIEPTSPVTYLGVSYSNKFTLVASEGRLTPEVSGDITGNYNWWGWQ